MKTKLLVSLIAFFAILTLATTVLASTGDLDVSVDSVTIKGIELAPSSTTNVAGFAGEIVPLKVIFTSDIDIKDVKVKAWIAGYREDIATSTRIIHLLNESTYSELLSLKLPSDIDPEEEYTLYVRIETKTDYKEEEFTLKIQRESYNVELLSIDADKTVKAGENLAVDIVLKNIGYEELTDIFVIASIPELDISKKAYFEDLTAKDCEDDDNCDKRDSAERKISLKIPANTKAGIYELKVEAYNADAKDVRTMKIAVVGTEQESNIVVPVTSKQVAVGKTETYELVIVNSGNKVGIYEIVPETADNMIVTAENPVITVKAGESEVVKINVKAVKEGTYSFAVNVNSEDKLVKRVVFNAIATKEVFASNIVILTVVLAIIFVVLLIVLIVLLTRKPEKSEELEESYY